MTRDELIAALQEMPDYIPVTTEDPRGTYRQVITVERRLNTIVLVLG